MDKVDIGLLSLVATLVLLALRLPIGIALALVSFVGIAAITSVGAAWGIVSTIPYSFVATWEFSAVPMFLLMGYLAARTDMTGGLFQAMRILLARVPGSLASASVGASALFAAASGSSLATSAALSKIAVPEMLRAGYDKGLATGVVAAAGTLSALIPPSILLILYGVFAEVSISQLLIAGILPGLLTGGVYTAMILIRARLQPHIAPQLEAAEHATLHRDRMRSLRETWPLAALILGIIGGLYGGIVTPTEAGGVGAALALVIALLQRRIGLRGMIEALREAMGVTAQIFFVGMGAVMYTRLLSLTGISALLTSAVGDFAGDPVLVVIAISVIYLILGMFLDPLGIILITMPVFLPMIEALDLNLIWFGIIVVKYIEIGMITPPMGLNVFVVKSVVGDRVPIWTIFRGIGWFLACEVVVMTLLISFPQISLFLPELMR